MMNKYTAFTSRMSLKRLKIDIQTKKVFGICTHITYVLKALLRSLVIWWYWLSLSVISLKEL